MTALRSKLSYRFLGAIIAVFLLCSFCAASYHTTEYQYYGKEPYYEFDTSGFIKTELIFVLISSAVFVLMLYTKKQIIIDDEKITVSNVLTRQSEFYMLSDISDFKWMHKNVQGTGVMSHGRTVSAQSASRQTATVFFADNRELTITNYQYSNLIELRARLYDYCIGKGIIHMAPLSERKMSSIRRGRLRH